MPQPTQTASLKRLLTSPTRLFARSEVLQNAAITPSRREPVAATLAAHSERRSNNDGRVAQHNRPARRAREPSWQSMETEFQRDQHWRAERPRSPRSPRPPCWSKTRVEIPPFSK